MSYKKNKKFVFGTIVLTFAFAMQLVSPVITSAQIGFDKIPKGQDIDSEQVIREFAKQRGIESENMSARFRGSLIGFLRRGDIRRLPLLLQVRLLETFARPHTYEPQTAFSEAASPSQLVQYFLLDTTQFQPNVFTAVIPGINDGTRPTAANAANGQLPTVGAVRTVVEPKDGFPTDPNDPRTLIDMFTDVSGLFVINNESGWYEGWIIRDIKVPPVAAPRANGNAQYGTMTEADRAANAARGTGNNAVTGNFATTDGNAVRKFSPTDHFPEVQANIIPIPVSLGTFNALQQSDVHSYWEFNPGTNWIFPHYELPFTGGTPGSFVNRMLGGITSIVPGSGPVGTGPRPFQSILNGNDPLVYGDNPNDPRDPDRAEVSNVNDPDRPTPGNPAHLETRLRFIPSRLTEEILLDVMVRRASFEPNITNVGQRFFDAYAYEVFLVDKNGDGIISFTEADINGTSDGMPNTRLYLPITSFNRYAMTRELDDGLLAPRFAPGQRGYTMSGDAVFVNPAVPASTGRDGDNR
ncbi:MAG: hypothetical protein ACR2L1_11570 [Pyrinomonadaceae bacterium]